MWIGKGTELHWGGTPHMKMCSDVLIYLESKTEPGVVNTGLHWGGHRTEKHILGGGDTAHTLGEHVNN